MTVGEALSRTLNDVIPSRPKGRGLPGQLHVSDDVRRALGKRYRVEERGMIEIKNRGTVRTWFVQDIAALAGR